MSIGIGRGDLAPYTGEWNLVTMGLRVEPVARRSNADRGTAGCCGTSLESDHYRSSSYVYICIYYYITGHLRVTIGLPGQKERRRTLPAALAAGRSVGAGSAGHGQGHRVEPDQVVPEL